MSKETNHSNDASKDPKDIPVTPENTAPAVDAADKTAVKQQGISAASMETKLEMLPELENLTKELLVERKELNKAVQSNHNPHKKSSDQTVIHKTSVSPKKQAKHDEAESSVVAAATETATTTETDDAVSAVVPAAPDIEKALSMEPSVKKEKKKMNPKMAKIIRTALIAVAIAVLGLIVVEGIRLAGIVQSVNFVKGGGLFGDTEMVVSESAIAKYVSHSDDTKNILLVGYDVDQEGISRSDSMIILTLDHEHQKIKMTSLMRDMYVRIPGHGKRKLNAAFVYGGPELLLQTIYANFGLQIDKYVCVDYKAFVNVVDEIGGVPVDIEEMELEQFNKYVGKKESNKIYEAGSYVFNGKQTLSYCRIRKVGSDTARTARQREVLSKIMKKCSKMSLLQLEHLLRITAPNVTTNLSLSEIFSLTAEGLGSMDYEMQGLRIPVDGAWYDLTVDGVSYVGVDLNANARYLFDFLYGDSETSSKLVENQTALDQANDEWERSRYERKKARESRG